MRNKSTEKKKINPWKLAYQVVFILVVMPSLLAFVAAIGFWAIYLCMTHPIVADNMNNLSYTLGLVNVALGVCFTQVIIAIKSINHLFPEE